MHPLELLFLLLWMRIRAQALAYPLRQGGQSNDIDLSNAGHFAFQNSADTIEGRRGHTLPKRTPWRHHDPEIITDSPPDTYYSPHPPHRHHYHHDDSQQDDYGGRTQAETSDTWSKWTAETWSDTEPSSEWQTEWRSTAESDGAKTPTDSEYSPSTPTRGLASKSVPLDDTPTTSGRRRPYPSRTYEASTVDNTIYSEPMSSPASDSVPVVGATRTTSGRRRPTASRTYEANTLDSTIYNTPMSSLASESASEVGATGTTSGRRRPTASDTYETNTLDSTIYSTPVSSLASESASEIDATSATSRTARSSSPDEASSTIYSDSTFSPLSSTVSFSSSSPSLYTTSRSYSTTQPLRITTTATPSSSSSSFDMIRPNLSSLHIVANITIHPDVPSQGIGPNPSDPSTTPRFDPSNLGAVTSTNNVPLGVIIGTVFGIIFGGLALFCVLFGINKLRQRKQSIESEERARRLRMGMASTSTLMLVRGQEPSGGTASAAGSIHTHEHGEYDRTGILVRDGQELPAGSGRGWIRFANQRRPSSVPAHPEGGDPSSTPLMQEYGSTSNSYPSRHVERSHSPTVPSPLRTNPVTGRDSPSGWI